MPVEDLLQPVQGEMIAVLAHDHVALLIRDEHLARAKGHRAAVESI